MAAKFNLVGEELPEDLQSVDQNYEPLTLNKSPSKSYNKKSGDKSGNKSGNKSGVELDIKLEPDADIDWSLVYKFIEKQYSDMLLFDNQNTPTRYISGNINKVLKAWKLKTTYTIDPKPHIITFKLYDMHMRKETNYGFLFVFEIDKIQSDIFKGIYGDTQTYIYGNYAFTHFNFSASLLSCDGEYRANLIRWQDMDYSKKMFKAIWIDIEDYISDVRERRGWNLTFGHFSPHVARYDNTLRDIDNIVRTESFMLTFLAASWFIFIFHEQSKRTNTHINQEFYEIFTKHYDEDFLIIENIIKKHTIAEIQKFLLSITVFYEILKDNPPEKKLNDNSHNTKLWCNTGFKMIPLNMSENLKCFNLKYKPWREYFAINKMSDLVINCITPGVPLFATYYYIMNSKKNLYDNKTQYLRLKNSEIAQEILKSLHEAQKGTYWVTGSNKKTDKKIKSWISNKFKKLDEKIQTPIEYATDEIIMSDASLMFIVEHVGVTFSNVFVFLEKSKTFHQKYGALLTDSGYHVFAKYIFNICYTLMTLNIKLGIIHGDLHLNNVTINLNAHRYDIDDFIVYDTQDKRYIFQHDYVNSFLIDFSRVIFDTEKYNLLTDLNLPKSHKMFDSYEEMVLVDKTELLNLYIMIFPQKERVKEELTVLFKKHYDAVFKLLSQLDIYMFSLRMLKLFEHFKLPIGKKITDLLDNIYKMSERSVTYDMNQLLDDHSYSTKILSEPSRYQTLIEKNFSEFVDGAYYDKITTIGEYYSIKNDFRFNSSQYSTFPRGVQTVEYEKDGKLYSFEGRNNINKYQGIARDRSARQMYEQLSKYQDT